jgi:hypothetical protein
MEATVYLLTFNAETLFASKNLTVLHHSMCRRCQLDNMDLPLAYATVRRRILAEGKYIHEPRKGWEYRIIERTLIRKPIQHRIGLFQDTVSKQS